MFIKDIIRAEDISDSGNRDVVTCSAEMDVTSVSRRLAEQKIGLVVICDDDGGVAGVLSERDIISAIGEHGRRSAAHRPESGAAFRRDPARGQVVAFVTVALAPNPRSSSRPKSTSALPPILLQNYLAGVETQQ